MTWCTSGTTSRARSSRGLQCSPGSALSLFTATAIGAHGAVLALAGVVPELCFELVEHVKAGRVAEARALQARLMPLARSIGPVNAVPGLKAALDLLGLAGGAPRPPLRPVGPQVIETLRKQLSELGVLETANAAR